jgi:hypothetical protein
MAAYNGNRSGEGKRIRHNFASVDIILGRKKANAGPINEKRQMKIW